MEGPGHPISLKVMRVSRPALASAWEPFFSSSPSFSARSTESILSLQGKAPLAGHPKTLRDLTHASELLTLPSAFGAIQLGETFSSVLCINNESNVDIDGVSLKVEMQTATTKLVIGDFGGPTYRLAAGDTLESLVSHEIKELGQHVLACTVSYRSSTPRHVGAEDDLGDPNIHSFRKFYKFAVTNPLSVKTKVHTPRSPSALLSVSEREKVFLEVHIQNLTQEPLWFERMQLECVEGWLVEDVNATIAAETGKKESIFSGSLSLIQPQDMRQYIYILSPTPAPSFPIHYNPGDTIPLGRLDISWRSSFGEPGRLLTSMLSRRIPLPHPPSQAPASALPLHLQRGSTVSLPPRSSYTPPVPHRPGTPPVPYRSHSPFRNRPASGPVPPRPQSPGAASPSAAVTPLPIPAPAIPPPDVETALTVRHIPYDSIRVDQPFSIACTITVSVSFPPFRQRQERVLHLAVQHVQVPRATMAPEPPKNPEPFSPHLPSGYSSPSSATTPVRKPLNLSLMEKLLTESPQRARFDGGPDDEERHQVDGVPLPPPYPNPGEEGRYAGSKGVVFLGPSATVLEPIIVSVSEADIARAQSTTDQEGADGFIKVAVSRDFDLAYLPIRKGFNAAGGLRLLLTDDRWRDVPVDGMKPRIEDDILGKAAMDVPVMKEWNVVAEVWVQS